MISAEDRAMLWDFGQLCNDLRAIVGFADSPFIPAYAAAGLDELERTVQWQTLLGPDSRCD